MATTEPGRRLEVWLLSSPVRVCRADGTVVLQSEWRTRKTADLLLLLALHAGAHVPVPRLLDALWPGVDEARGRASLRTAASTLRKILGGNHIERNLHGLALTGARVDTETLLHCAEAVRNAVATGRPADVVAPADSAVALYGSDLAPFDADSEWAAAERERLRRAFTELLADAAEAAVTAGEPRKAVGYAARLLEVNPFDERAYRCTMLAYAGLGELEHAVAAYVRCRSFLSDELGLDPAPQTREAYLAVLRAGQADADAQTPPAPESRPVELESRLIKAATCFARRDLRRGDAQIKAARRESMDSRYRAAMNVVVAEHSVLLGDSAKVVEMLASAHETLEADPTPLTLPSGLDVGSLLALAQHDLDLRQISTPQLSAALKAERIPAWLALRILVERGDVDEATTLAAQRRFQAGEADVRTGATPVLLEALARGHLYGRTGRTEEALEVLDSALDLALRSEAALLLPEIAARTALLQAAYDSGAAAANLDLAEEMLGGGVFPRERVVTVLARCAIRWVNGRTEAAASGASLASQIAEDVGLVHAVAEAHEWQRRYAPEAPFVPRPRGAAAATVDH